MAIGPNAVDDCEGVTIFGYTWDEIKRTQQGGEYQPGFTNRSQPTAIGNCWSATGGLLLWMRAANTLAAHAGW